MKGFFSRFSLGGFYLSNDEKKLPQWIFYGGMHKILNSLIIKRKNPNL